MVGFFPPKKKGSATIAIKTKAQGIIIMAIIPPVDNPPELFFCLYRAISSVEEVASVDEVVSVEEVASVDEIVSLDDIASVDEFVLLLMK